MSYINSFISLILIIGLISTVNAYTLNYGVFNSMTFNPLSNASIQATITDNITRVYSNDDGYGSLSVTTIGTYTILVDKLGYNSYTTSLAVATDNSYTAYLSPSSNEGIIRLTFNDLTLNDHDFCVYYKDNNRLKECFKLNDTVQILVNMNFTIKPKITALDLASSPSTIGKLSDLYAPVILAIAFTIIAVMVVLYGLYKLIKK